MRAHLRAGLSRIAEIGDQRICQRADRTADMTPAVIDAGRPAFVFRRVDADRGGREPHADRLKTLLPDVAAGKRLHRRHRIGFSRRPPDFLGLGIAGDADVVGDLVPVWRDVGVIDRPVEPFAVGALDLEVVRHQGGESWRSSAALRRRHPSRLGTHSHKGSCLRAGTAARPV